MLHPGLTDSRALAPKLGVLAQRFHVFAPYRLGHGRTSDVDGPMTYELMARDTVRFLESVVGRPAHLLGSSDGAVVALFVALFRPDLLRRLVCVAGVFHRDGWVPSAIDPDVPPPEFMATSYAEVSPDGPEHLPVVVAKLARMHTEGPTLTDDDLVTISNRAL